LVRGHQRHQSTASPLDEPLSTIERKGKKDGHPTNLQRMTLKQSEWLFHSNDSESNRSIYLDSCCPVLLSQHSEKERERERENGKRMVRTKQGLLLRKPKHLIQSDIESDIRDHNPKKFK